MPPRKKWSKENMMKAVQAVKNKEMGFLKASKVFEVPRSTLENYVNHPTKSCEDLLQVPLGRRPVLGKLEQDLVEYCKEMDQRFHGLRRRDIRVLAYQLAVKNELPNNFTQSKGMAGEKWLKNFLKRHPSLAVRTPRAVSLSRVKNFTKEKVDAFFDLLKPELDKIQFNPHKIFNVDETGITVVQGTRSKVISMKGKKEVGKLSSAERGALITVVICMNAAGFYVPPLIVFPRTNMKAELLDGTPPGTIAATHPSGWIQLPIFTEWLLHFVKFVKATKDDPVVLILDGHYSHTRNISVIDVGRENGVIIVCLPPHSTHKLQPLDVAFMAPFKKFYSNEIENWLDAHPFRALTVYQVGALFGRAYMRAATIETAVNGFKKCGIFPFDRLKFGETDFIDETPNDIQGQSASLVETPAVTPLFQPVPSVSSSTAMDISTDTPYDIAPSTSSARPVSPKDIRPLPVMKSTACRAQSRCGKAVVITSSPYKKELKESFEKKTINQAKRLKTEETAEIKKGKGKNLQGKPYKPKGGKQADKSDDSTGNMEELQGNEIEQEVQNVDASKTPPKAVKTLFPRKKNTKKRHDQESSDSDDVDSNVQLVSTDDEDSADECDCLYCGQPYKLDTRGEQWIRCTKCLLWAHELCADSDNRKTFVCDHCKAH